MKKSIYNNKATLFSLLIFLVLFVSSCSSSKTSVIWVNSLKTQCDAGAGKMQCISIYRGDQLANADWELFYTAIEGFNFEPGYFQKIEISEEHLAENTVPADGSSIKYKLIKTLEKKFDKRIILNDIWVAKRIYQNSTNDMETLPQMEINLAKMKVLGNNGCNNFNGGIDLITASDIHFGNMASTRKMCVNMEIPNLFDKAMYASTTYKLDGTTLTFFDKKNKETVFFIKVD